MRIHLRLGLAIILVCLLGIGTGVIAKEFTIPTVHIEAMINEDGSMWVTEQRTYRFRGEYGWASQWISTRGSSGISHISVAEDQQPFAETVSRIPGTFTVNTEPDKVQISWFFTAKDEERTFTLRYLVQNAIHVFSDVAELYWQFIGNDWSVSTQQAEVLVRLPGAVAPDTIRVWGHGPLHGAVKVLDPTTATWLIDNLPARTFLEARMTFPPSLVPQATLRSDKPGLPSILAEEEKRAQRANFRRDALRHDATLAVILLALQVLLAIHIRRQYMSPYPSTFQAEHLSEPPSGYTPAELGVLLHGRNNPQDAAATLLDLASRKFLLLTPYQIGNTKDYGITPVAEAPKEELTAYEKYLIRLVSKTIPNWLDETRPITFTDIQRYAKAKPQAFATWYDRWQKAVQSATESRGFYDETIQPIRKLVFFLGLGSAVVGLILLVVSYVYTGCAFFLSSVVYFVLSAAAKRHAPDARTDYLKWKAFGRYLRESDELPSSPATVAIWERFAVYAIVLGVVRDVNRKLMAFQPYFEQDPFYPTSWLFIYTMNTGSRRQYLTSKLCGSFTSAITTSQSSSASGAGGGFSSGGGGGGGGGGGSAG